MQPIQVQNVGKQCIFFSTFLDLLRNPRQYKNKPNNFIRPRAVLEAFDPDLCANLEGRYPLILKVCWRITVFSIYQIWTMFADILRGVTLRH